MSAIPHLPNTSLRPLCLTWLTLVALTLLSLALSHWSGSANAHWLLPLLVAAIVWIKGWLIAVHFIESRLATPFIGNVLRVFIAFTPVALVLTAFFGPEFARWASL